MPIYQRFVRDVLQPLSLWRAGETAQLRYQRELERTQFFTAEQVRALQLQRLRTLLAHAYERCPFYRDRFDAVPASTPDDLSSLEDLQVALPPCWKNAKSRSRAAAWSPRAGQQDDLLLQLGETGGSTGTPIRFFLNRDRKSLARRRHPAAQPLGRLGAGRPRCCRHLGRARKTGHPPKACRARLRARSSCGEPLWLDTANLTEQRMEEFHTGAYSAGGRSR